MSSPDDDLDTRDAGDLTILMSQRSAKAHEQEEEDRKTAAPTQPVTITQVQQSIPMPFDSDAVMAADDEYDADPAELTTAPAVAVVPMLVPVDVASDDIEADASIVDAMKKEHVMPTDDASTTMAPPQPVASHPPQQQQQQQQSSLFDDPEPAMIAAAESSTRKEMDDSMKNPLERAGESIEKGRTAQAFEHFGESIAHGRIAETAASVGRSLKDASLAVEHRMEQGFAAAAHLKDRILHREQAAPPHSETQQRSPTYVTGAIHPESQSTQDTMPSWVHETSHVSKMDREYPTSSEQLDPHSHSVVLTSPIVVPVVPVVVPVVEIVAPQASVANATTSPAGLAAKSKSHPTSITEDELLKLTYNP